MGRSLSSNASWYKITAQKCCNRATLMLERAFRLVEDSIPEHGTTRVKCSNLRLCRQPDYQQTRQQRHLNGAGKFGLQVRDCRSTASIGELVRIHEYLNCYLLRCTGLRSQKCAPCVTTSRRADAIVKGCGLKEIGMRICSAPSLERC